DSLASNPSLSVLEEIRCLRRMHSEVAAATLLEMATMRGAEALGLASVIGSVSAGKSADITVVPLDAGGPVDPIENLLASSLNPVATFVRGKRVRF
ncbi:MAG: amidohydrolase family protein, partial [Planctomycetes bacterium]|nr:amidohydrolase family protein [Planctomycetota bacterium]